MAISDAMPVLQRVSESWRYEWIVDYAGRKDEAGVGSFCLDGSEQAVIHFYWGVYG